MVLASQDDGSGRLTRWYQRMGFERSGVNALGYPSLQAPIGRVLAGVAQAKVAPPIPPAAGPIPPAGSGPPRRVAHGAITPSSPAPQPRIPDVAHGGGAATRSTKREGRHPVQPGRDAATPRTVGARVNLPGVSSATHPASARRSGLSPGFRSLQMMEARGSGGNDPFYQNYLKRFATWGQVRRNVRFQTKHAMISPSGYIKIPIFIEGTDEQVASCQIKYSDGALELSQMFVEDGYRGRGLTYLLALAACVYARNHLGAPPDTTVWLEANSMSAMDNSTLVGIYERCGFARAGKTASGHPLLTGALNWIEATCGSAVDSKNILGG